MAVPLYLELLYGPICKAMSIVQTYGSVTRWSSYGAPRKRRLLTDEAGTTSLSCCIFNTFLLMTPLPIFP